MATLRNFGQDLAFLRQHIDSIVLANSDDQQVVVVPQWQGRIMTSTTRGADGFSYGWVNYDRITSGKIEPQINLFGGEDRFWISPEGSQFSFFFDPGVEMDLVNWRTPPELDIHPFDIFDQQEDQVTFQKKFQLTNYSGSIFEMQVDRTVRINSDDQTAVNLGMAIPDGVFSVSHESHNRVYNAGTQDWSADCGLPAVWILCMNKPSSSATVMVPFQSGSIEERGKIVTADYFGKLDSKRLRICDESNLIFFLGDGKMRSKLGVAFERAVNVLGAWDSEHQCMTIAQFNLPTDIDVGYTNNLWKVVEEPYRGDVVNSYNDGPNENGRNWMACSCIKSRRLAVRNRPTNPGYPRYTRDYDFHGKLKKRRQESPFQDSRPFGHRN